MAKKKTAKKKTKSMAKKKTASPMMAIVPVAPPAPLQVRSVIPNVTATIKNLEKVRRFIQVSFNQELRREEARFKLGARAKITEAERRELEIDFGTIPGVDKPFLKQPGAEKFLFWLNLRPKFVNHYTEIEEPVKGHLEVVSRVLFYSKVTGEEVFEGPDCSCTTLESNYRFRWVARRDNQDEYVKPSQEEMIALKHQGLGRLRKIDEYKRGVKTGQKIWVWYDRTENPNIYDERNKVRQIGEKRALVKGVRNMGALSEIFVTDPGDWDLVADSEWEEGEEEGNPFTESDYTPSGGTIVQADGKTPSGRVVDTRPQKEAIAAAKIEDFKQKAEERQNAPQTAPQPAPQPDKPASAPAEPAAPTPTEPAPRVRVVKLNDLGDLSVTGTKALEDHKEMARFLVDIAARSAKDRTNALWFKIEAIYVEGFFKICEKNKFRVE